MDTLLTGQKLINTSQSKAEVPLGPPRQMEELIKNSYLFDKMSENGERCQSVSLKVQDDVVKGHVLSTKLKENQFTAT